MKTNNDLIKKYSTGQVYISPGGIDYDDNRLRTHYYCEGKPDQLIGDYLDHMSRPVSQRCSKLPKFSEDGVLRPAGIDITEEEIKWLEIEYKLREAINLAKHKLRPWFVVMED